jgi:hypothetical protein
VCSSDLVFEVEKQKNHQRTLASFFGKNYCIHTKSKRETFASKTKSAERFAVGSNEGML